jgi:hypothetical protein
MKSSTSQFTAKAPPPEAQRGSNGPVAADEIRQLAYRLWEERGRPDGSEQEDWYEAEKRCAGQGPAAA